VPPELGQLQHYRESCTWAVKNCTEEFKTNVVLDEAIGRFKEPLISRTSFVLKALGLIYDRDIVYKLAVEH